MTFDPSAAAAPDSGLFGLSTTPAQARIVIIPVPFDATTSYGGGASGGPAAVLRASRQVDLHDQHFGNVFEHGIAMLPIPAAVLRRSREARRAAAGIIERGGADPDSAADRRALMRVDAACAAVQAGVRQDAEALLDAGQVPGLLGGDHSTPLGLIEAAAARAGGGGRGGLGILHLDAHMDLRERFEGFGQSHASVMHNVLRTCPGVTRLVQVGVRDYCDAELDVVRRERGRVKVIYDAQIHASAHRLGRAPPLESLIAGAIAALPRLVHVSFDIDALDPSLCPHTGTPVPGGLSFNLAAYVLSMLAGSGRRVTSFDLVEVCPSPDEHAPEWDANVGARVLYKLCGCAGATLRVRPPVRRRSRTRPA